jgi:hypothetical protein
MPAINNKTAQIVTMVIAPGQVYPILQTGDNFYIIISTGVISVKPNNGGENSYSQGTGQQYPAGNEFTNLQIKNNNASSVVFSIFVGFGSYIDNRVILNDPFLSNVVYPTAPTPNVTNNINITDKSGQAILDINGNNYLALNRVAIYITNYDLASTYNLQDYLHIVGTAVGVSPATQIVFNASGDFSIHIPSSTINAVVSEVYQAVKPSLSA